MSELDRCWKNCLRMWKWISENLPEGFSLLSFDEKKTIVNRLKRQWLTQHRFTCNVLENCFFCNYALKREGCITDCPGTMVDKSFHCNPHNDKQSWVHNPKGFYRRLLKLDAKRKAT